jgi:hypothetical protein
MKNVLFGKKKIILCHKQHFVEHKIKQKSVLNTGIKLFKHLPVRIKKVDNFNCFKKEVTAVLLNNSCYSIEEFLQSKIV